MQKETSISKTYSTAYDDNREALELARELKFCLRTKYIATKYYYLRHAIVKGKSKL